LLLTKCKIDSLKPQDKPKKFFDGHGLYIEVYPNGSKIWRQKYILNGKTTRKSFGSYPLVSLKKAREMSEHLRLELKTKEMGYTQEIKNISIKELIQEWKDNFYPKLSQNTIKKYNILVDKYLIPSLGHFICSKITASLILTVLLKPIADKKLLETAHRCKFLLGRIFRYAVATGQIERDFTQDLSGALPPPIVVHRASIIDKNKLGRLLKDIQNYTGSPEVIYALRILPYVFVRPGELRHAEWTEIDFPNKIWRIPAEKMKMRTSHIVPLSKQVVQLLEELKCFTGTGKYLFPGARTEKRPISDVTINAALRYLGYKKEEICGHGFRSTASTLLNEQGYNRDWIERQLAHNGNSVREIYNYAEYLPERTKMMQEWADFLDSLRG
jgi:integrase